MNKLLVIIILAASLSVAAADDKQGATAVDMKKPITIDQALEIAFCQSPEIKVALDQVQKSTAQIAEARANYMPKFNAEVQQIYQGPAVTFNNPALSPTPITFQAAENTLGTGNVLLPLDINNKLGYVTQIAKYQSRIDYLNLRGVSQKLIYEVKSAYYNLLRARGQEDVAQAAVDVANARLKETSAKFSAGTAPKFDVTSSQVQVANLTQDLIAAKSRVAVERSALNRLLGIDVNSPTEVVETDVKVDNIKVDIPKSVQQGQTQRPEIVAAETAVSLNRTNTKLQRTAVLPSLNGAGTATYNVQSTGFTTQNISWIALLDLKIPIWDGGVTKAKVAQAFADVNRSTDELDQLKLGVGLEVRTAALNLQEAIERVSTTAEAVSLAEESLRLANVRYSAGISTIVEVTDAQTSLTRAQFYAVQAKYDYVIALADLQRATSTQPEVQKLQLLAPQHRTS